MKKTTIKDMHKIAAKQGGKCLSKEYINARTKLKWKCKEGHIWKSTPHHVKRGHWCRKCGYKKCGEKQRFTLKDMHKIASKYGGKCLSKKYINSAKKLKWQCDKGHVFTRYPFDLRKGMWCSYCRGTRHTIESMQDLAKTKGGKCLSKKYINAGTKLKWKCKEGHTWFAIYPPIKYGHWCPVCASKALRKRHASSKRQR